METFAPVMSCDSLQQSGKKTHKVHRTTVLPAKSNTGVMFCLQRYQGLRIDGSLVYTQVIYRFALDEVDGVYK